MPANDTPSPSMPAVSGLISATVMMVDDEPITIDVVQAYLEEAGYRNFVTVSEPETALATFASHVPDVLLLDLVMPGMSGFDILQQIRGDKRYEHIPVIVLTSSTDSQDKLKALELGATDFLAKPVDASELVLRLRNTLAAKAYLDRLTSFDTLTGLYNRKTFGEHVEWALRMARRNKQEGALLHLNVDRFRKVNEALGPAMGDEFLRQFARRMLQAVRAGGAVTSTQVEQTERLDRHLARLGGDEFAVLLTEIDQPDHVAGTAQRLLDAVGKSYDLGGHDVFMTCSMGIAVFPLDGMQREDLAQRAALALKGAKAQGGNTYSFYAAELNNRSLQTLSLQSELHNAVARNEFQLYYQPKIDAATGSVTGTEALLRWQHPRRGLVSPAEFIPLAEETGLIVPIGAWVLREACRQIASLLAQGLSPPAVAVNISARQLAHRDFLATVQEILDAHPFDRRHLKIEITESTLMGDKDKNLATLNQLRDLGLEISLDDFGTGYSSLSYLRHFPVRELKVDRSFVNEIDAQGTANSRALIQAMIAMAHVLGLKVVAEGVETEAQAAFLRSNGCDQLQGYLFARPMPADALVEYIKR